MYTIVPKSIEDPYEHDHDMQTCRYEGLIYVLRVDNYHGCVEAASSSLMANFEQVLEISKSQRLKSGSRSLRNNFDQQYIHSAKLSHELIDYLRDRFSGRFDSLAREEMLRDPSTRSRAESDEWISLPQHISTIYMARLAKELSKATGSSPVSEYVDFLAAYRASESVDFLYPRTREEGLPTQQVIAAVIENTIVAPDTPINDLIRYRKDNRSQLADFIEYIREFEHLLSVYGGNPQVFFELKIEPELMRLRTSLSKHGIAWAAGGLLAFTAVPDSSEAISSLLQINGVAGLAATGALVALGSYTGLRAGRSQLVSNNRLGYLYNVDQRFGLDEIQKAIQRETHRNRQ